MLNLLALNLLFEDYDVNKLFLKGHYISKVSSGYDQHIREG